MHRLARLDHRYVWHPFTQMRDWLKHEPIVIVAGRGAVLADARGREYLDANSSIWTNLHGHGVPAIDRALQRQLRRIAHSSALGLANEPASRLAARLVQAAGRSYPAGSRRPRPLLSKVFFSDDGSTALEVALKQSYEFARRCRGLRQPRFLSLEGAYHGDTIGAVSLGHIDVFHKSYAGLLFKSGTVMAPYCYRCRFNRAAPERADARIYRQCRHECVDQVEKEFLRQRRRGNPYAGMVIEPLMQGAAGLIPQPPGWLRRVAEIVRSEGAHLIADEVMTSMGRACTVSPANRSSGRAPLFACQQEGVQPDFLCLAKGLTGGYLPMAATLTSQEVFAAFLGEYAEFKTFFHGHSYTANQLGAAAALASLDLLQGAACLRQRGRLQEVLQAELSSLWDLPNVGDIRLEGLVAGVELVRNWRTREPFPLSERAGWEVCDAMARRGVLTRPIGNVVVIMPPYCTTLPQVRTMVQTLREAAEERLGAPRRRALGRSRSA